MTNLSPEALTDLAREIVTGLAEWLIEQVPPHLRRLVVMIMENPDKGPLLWVLEDKISMLHVRPYAPTNMERSRAHHFDRSNPHRT